MQAMSNWARQHTIKARLLLCILHTCLVMAAMQLCRLLAFRHVAVSFTATLFICIVGFGLVLATRYFKNSIHSHIAQFRLQKFRFLLTGFCCIVLIIGFYSSGTFLRFHLYSSLNGAFTEKTAKTAKPAFESYDDKKMFYEDLKTYYKTLSKKELRKELRHELKNLAKSPGDGANTAYIVLIILGMLLALGAVTSIACSLACAGSDALAVLVGVGGTIGVIWLAVYLIKSLNKKKEPIRERPAPAG